MENYEPQTRLFKTLMHPARLAILDILRDGEECVCHMEAALGYRQAYISQQLMVLRDAGLVQDRREGWNIFYRVTKPEVFAVIDAAQDVVGKARRAARRRHSVVEACPCPKCSPVAEAAAH
jgi:ArsR family transcriptional regulator